MDIIDIDQEINQFPREYLLNGKIPLPDFGNVVTIPSKQYTSRFKLVGPGNIWSEPLFIESTSNSAPLMKTTPSQFNTGVIPGADSEYFYTGSANFNPRVARPMTDPRFSNGNSESELWGALRESVKGSAYLGGRLPDGYSARRHPTTAETRLALGYDEYGLEAEVDQYVGALAETHATVLAAKKAAFSGGQAVRDAIQKVGVAALQEKSRTAGQWGEFVERNIPANSLGQNSRLGATLGTADGEGARSLLETRLYRAYQNPHTAQGEQVLVKTRYAPPKLGYSGAYPTAGRTYPSAAQGEQSIQQMFVHTMETRLAEEPQSIPNSNLMKWLAQEKERQTQVIYPQSATQQPPSAGLGPSLPVPNSTGLGQPAPPAGGGLDQVASPGNRGGANAYTSPSIQIGGSSGRRGSFDNNQWGNSTDFDRPLRR